MTTTILFDHAEQPENAEEACRAITRTLMPVTDYGRRETASYLCQLVNVLSGDEEAWERSRFPLGLFANAAQYDAEAQISAIEHALDLARRADPAYREQERRLAQGLPAHEPGPTLGEVKAAQKVLAAYGDDASEEAALKVLASMSDQEATG